MTRNAQKKMRSLTLLLCSAVLLVCVGIGATFAYLISQDSVTNSFTVGNVSITLDEAAVNTDGTLIEGAERVQANRYHLIPGRSYSKDPTVHVNSGSEDCWVFVKLDNGIAEIEASGSGTIAAQLAANGWTAVAGETGVYAYGAVAEAGDELALFSSFTIGSDVDVSDYAEETIEITAYAIQAEGFADAATAWQAIGA